MLKQRESSTFMGRRAPAVDLLWHPAPYCVSGQISPQAEERPAPKKLPDRISVRLMLFFFPINTLFGAEELHIASSRADDKATL